jgi:hypothetical protein
VSEGYPASGGEEARCSSESSEESRIAFPAWRQAEKISNRTGWKRWLGGDKNSRV